MDDRQDSLDHELQMALELSRRTYEEEAGRRAEKEEVDLISMEDPRVIDMNRKIDRIKQLYDGGGGVQQPSVISTRSFNHHNGGSHYPMSCVPSTSAQFGFEQGLVPSTSSPALGFEQRVHEIAAANASFHRQASFTLPGYQNNVYPVNQSSYGAVPTLPVPAYGEVPQNNTPTRNALIIPFRSENGDLIDLSPSPRPVRARSITLDERANSEGTALWKQASFEQTLLTADNLQRDDASTNDFFREVEELSSMVRRLAVTEGHDVFFLSHFVDFFTTTADTVKLVVHQDDTWRQDVPDDPQSLGFGPDVRSSAQEILQEVLLRLLPQEEIAKNGGSIPLEEYALKVCGTDEFLVPSSTLGKHSFVADFVSRGKDVELEVGKRRLRRVQPYPNVSRRSPTSTLPVNKELFESFKDALEKHLSMCIDESHDFKKRQGVIQSVRMVCTFMNQTMPSELVAAVDSLSGARAKEELLYGMHCIVGAVIKLFYMYCRSAPMNFSVKLDQPAPDNTEFQDSSQCWEKLLIHVESMHNLPNLWLRKYRSFYAEAHLMYGPKSYGMVSSSMRAQTSRYNFTYVPLQFWVDFDIQLPSLPRETQVCYIVYGIPADDEECVGGATGAAGHATCAHRIATASIPLYSQQGYLLQGPVLAPLMTMQDNVVQPWGPRPLIRSAEDPVLVLKYLEYNQAIRTWRRFESLPRADQDLLIAVVDESISHLLVEDDKQLLWSNRDALRHIPKALPLVLASSFSWDSYSLSNIYPLLDGWSELPPATAIELLLPYFPDEYVRKKALKYLRKASTEFLFNILPQFAEALRYEAFENSALARFLLEQSTKDRRFAFELYWQLRHRVDDVRNQAYSARCRLLCEKLLDLNIPGFCDEIAYQHDFLEMLDRLSQDVKSSPESIADIKLKDGLARIDDEIGVQNIRLPIYPAFQCVQVDADGCGIFNSLTKPMKIRFKGRRADFGIIYKAGDDLRQDAIVLQLVRVMNNIWLEQQLDLRMVTFRCLPTGNRKGLIELVPDCSTLREIQIASGVTGVIRDDVLNEWLLRRNPSEFQYKAALANFRRSCAGWCVATYVLGIGDRHNDNILVTSSGHVFHIDFGKYMGDWQMAGGFKRDRVPFVLTQDMAYVINGGSQKTTEHFQMFVDDCCKAFNLLRKNCSMIINIMRFLMVFPMSCSDIPGMNVEAFDFVESNLMLNLTDLEATMMFTRMVEDSLRSRFPRLNFVAHTLAQLKSSSGLLSAFSRTDDMNRLSFISDLYTEKEDGRILSMQVNSYEKWFTPEKVYMYKILIRRANENVDCVVYRSFAEFEELHLKLRYRFSNGAIPRLKNRAGAGREMVHQVAQKRQVELQQFLHGLFGMSNEVAHCDLIYTFFHAIHRDSEPDKARRL
ncbi:phosphatidylinositol 3-and 4-kinase [Aphelenchoides avenae]|nr:phosphatidylinositol 3-and 4-kinase [Aphelenchus avenae]